MKTFNSPGDSRMVVKIFKCELKEGANRSSLKILDFQKRLFLVGICPIYSNDFRLNDVRRDQWSNPGQGFKDQPLVMGL